MKIPFFILILLLSFFQVVGQNNSPLDQFIINDSIKNSKIKTRPTYDTIIPLNIEKIKKHGTPNILNYILVDENYGTWCKKYLYVITFTDRSIRIYNNETDSLSKEVYSTFEYTQQSYLASTKDNWEIFTDGPYPKNPAWKPRASISKTKFDLIKKLWHEHYIGYKDGIMTKTIQTH